MTNDPLTHNFTFVFQFVALPGLFLRGVSNYFAFLVCIASAFPSFIVGDHLPSVPSWFVQPLPFGSTSIHCKDWKELQRKLCETIRGYRKRRCKAPTVLWQGRASEFSSGVECGSQWTLVGPIRA